MNEIMIDPLVKSCLIIFFGRIIDVSFGTLKTVLTVKEKTLQAAMCGFCEVFIWFIVVRDALNSDAPVIALAIAYACGYASGTLVGGKLSKVIIKGHVTVEVFTSDRSDLVPNHLREDGYVLTIINVNDINRANPQYGSPKFMIIADIDKHQVKDFEKRVRELDPGAFIILRETKGFGNAYSRPGK